MMLQKFLIFIFFLAMTAKVAAEEVTYQYPVRPEDAPKLTEVVRLMDFLRTKYEPQIIKQGLSFRWNFDWNQSYIGAGSSIYQNEFSILFLGGFARMPESNFGVVALTLCHEFGHLLGGYPKQRLHNKDEDDWSSAEGQSDWFAAMECLPAVYSHFGQPKNVLNFCKHSKKAELCSFIVEAGFDFSRINFKYFNTDLSRPTKSEPRVDFWAPEKPETTLNSSYPSMQCRLDTYKTAALCMGKDLASCKRPRCWFIEPYPLTVH